ncbi:flocculation-associated PEP-CTERM protein PepA [Trichloromonas sp.]|uniref:flocculation-associated PEP-CTERM protein PepA n=1 Tax=Trichloromonas sp. TaxID=3069249 RepID=UPI003D817EFD
MKRTRSKFFGVLLALAMVVSVGVSDSRAYTIGFDEDGAGVGVMKDITLINYYTDTGLALDFNPFAPTPFNIEFLLQGRVSSFQNSGLPVIFPGIALNTNEITFTARFIERVVDVQTVGGTTTAIFQSGNLGSEFKMYADSTPDANPNNVSGYNDGVEILSATMVSQTSSFSSTVPGALGTGSFNVVLSVDSYDNTYWDIPFDLFLFQLVTTGTLNQPSTFTPAVMWNGTSIAAAAAAGRNPQYLKFDGSTDFNVVPEPSTILLLGLGLVSVGVLARRRK